MYIPPQYFLQGKKLVKAVRGGPWDIRYRLIFVKHVIIPFDYRSIFVCGHSVHHGRE